MQKLNSARILLVAALFILALTSLSYAGEIFVISDIKEFAWEYVNAIRALQTEEPEAIPIFQMEIVERLENGKIRFNNEGEDIRAEIKTLRSKEQALYKTEPTEKLLFLEENKKAEKDLMRARENNSSANENLGDKQAGGGDGDQGSMGPSTP